MPAPPVRRSLRQQARTVGPVYALAAAVLGSAYVVAFALAHAFDREFGLLIEDPAYILEAPLYTGTFAYLGVLGWWTAAVSTALAGGVLRAAGRKTEAAPLLGLAALSVLVAVDDMFQVHEVILDQRLGIPQYVSYLAYVALFGLYIARSRESLRETDWLLFALFGALFALSAVVDQFGDLTDQHHDTTEEGLELLGTLAFALYSVRWAFTRLAPQSPLSS